MKNIIIVDDDPDNREQLLRLLDYTEHKAVAVGSVDEAVGKCDILLVDISAVCPPRKAPLALFDAVDAYRPILAFLNNRPGCTVIIHTALSRETAQGVADDVVARSPDTIVKIADVLNWDKTLQLIAIS